MTAVDLAAVEQTAADAKAEADQRRAAERAEWRAWRNEGIGASDVPAILGLSRFGSPFSVWAEKTGVIPLDEDDEQDDDYTEFGRWAELMINPWFTHRTGLHIGGAQVWVEHPDKPWMRCTPDGMVFESPAVAADAATLRRNDNPAGLAEALQASLGPHEIKTRPYGRRYLELPPDIEAQALWQMIVTGATHSWISVLHGRRLEIYDLALDPDEAAFVVRQVETFWHQHVLAGVAPEIDGHEATLAALAALYPNVKAGKKVDIDHVSGALAMIREAKRWEKAAQTLIDAGKAAVVWAMGDAHTGLVNGETACTLGRQTSKRTCENCGHVAESAPFRVLLPKGPWK